MSKEIIYPVPQKLLQDPKPYINNFDDYKTLWQESISDPSQFFAKVKKKLSNLILHIFNPQTCVYRQQKNTCTGIGLLKQP